MDAAATRKVPCPICRRPVSYTHLDVYKRQGQQIAAGSIIVRQRGTKFHAGPGVGMGKDHTLFALVDGAVSFEVKGALNRQTVFVTPA